MRICQVAPLQVLADRGLASKRQFSAIARIVAGKLGRKTRLKTDAEGRAEDRLRDEVLGFEWY